MAKYEEKFIVINRKHIEELSKIHPIMTEGFLIHLETIAPYLPDNKYYVCNQDEPYAEKVLQIILEGEDEKANFGAGVSYASPASSGVQTAGQDFNDVFWVLLQDIEHKIDPEKDLLSKRDVEAGYRIWNKIHKSELHARWDKR